MRIHTAVLAVFLGGCTLHMGELAYQPLTDGRVGYAEQLSVEFDAGGKKHSSYVVKYQYMPMWRKPIDGKALKVNLFFRAAEFTRERGQRYFVLASNLEGMIDPHAPYEPQKLPGTQGEWDFLSESIIIILCNDPNDAREVADNLPHKVVYDANKVIADLSPFVLGRGAPK